MQKFFSFLIVIVFLFNEKNSNAQCTIAISNIVNPICYGTCNGTAEANGSNGVAPYTYTSSPNGNINANTGQMNNLCAGIYTVMVTDAALCTATTILSITEPPSLTLNATILSGPSCLPGCDGAAQATAIGGTAPYTYAVTAPATININTGSMSGLCAGVYTVSVSDANNCIATSIMYVMPPPAVNIYVNNIVNPVCGANCTGEITIGASGGSPPYSYTISGGALINLAGQASNLCPGTYTITLTDANGCTATTIANIATPPGMTPLIAVNNITNATCNGSCDGAAQVTATAGLAPYTFSINPGPAIVNPQTGAVYAACAGSYTVQVTDANACAVTSSFIITEPLLVSMNLTTNDANCNGTCDGSIVPTAVGGISPYTYTITGNNFNGLCAGAYTVTATDANNCLASSTAILVQGVYNNSIDPALTFGVGSVTSNATGGVPPYQYSLNGGPFGAGNTFSMLCAGNYTLTIKDNLGNGCFKDTVFNIATAATAFPGGTVVPYLVQPSCALTNDGMISLIVTPANTYGYQWSNGANTFSNTNLLQNTYSVTITSPAGECVQNSYSLPALGINCGNISGNVWYDSILNCQPDNPEPGIANTMLVVNPGNYITFSDAQGHFSFNGLPFGNYTVEHQNNISAFQTHCGNNFLTTLSNANPNQSINFADSVKNNLDYYVYLSNPQCFVVANPIKMKRLHYRHNNANGMYYNNTATVFMVLDSINHFQSASMVPSSISGDTLFWQVNTVAYTGNTFIDVYFQFPINYNAASFFPLKIGIRNTQYTDTLLYNNLQSLVIPFCNGYDPNNKIVMPKGEGPSGNLDISDSLTKLMTYWINFQNTGNAPAYNIVIEDTLSDKLDLQTFRVLSASHQYQLEVLNNEVIRWKFYNIMLPDSNANEAASHGNIIYQVKQKNTNIVGDQIRNKAYIYFDYNPPVITNEALNTLVAPSFLQQIEKQNQLLIYPNPAQGMVYIDSDEPISEVIVYDIHLKKQKKYSFTPTRSTRLELHSLLPGLYYFKANKGVPKKVIITK